MAVRLQVVFDAADPARLAAFWGEALGYVEQDPPEGFASWEAWAEANAIPREEWDNYDARVDPDGVGPRLYFQRVPEPKTAKNRVHLDLAVGGDRSTPPKEARARIAAAVERAVAAGATKVGTQVFDGFTLERIDVGEATLRVRHGGSGPPLLLLLHEHPRTHATWHRVAPLLAGDHTVVCPDLLQAGHGPRLPGPDGRPRP